MGLPWNKFVGWWQMERLQCVVKRIAWQDLREVAEGTGELMVYHGIIHQESLCGKALRMEHVMSAVSHAVNFISPVQSFLKELDSVYGDLPWIYQFMESKKETTELWDKKLCQLVFLSDIMKHLDVLSFRGMTIWSQMCTLLCGPLESSFVCRRCSKKTWPIFRAANPWKGRSLAPCSHLHNLQENSAYLVQLANFEPQKSRFELHSNPFEVVESAPIKLQMKLTEHQCSDAPKAKYDYVGAAQFPQFIPETVPQLCTEVQMLSMFGSTYLCIPCNFSLWWRQTKTHRGRLADDHLHSILRISSPQSLTNIDEFASKMRCQVSGLNKCASEHVRLQQTEP